MNRFKKRTIALVLASVVTVVGAFGADSYKNSLMGLSFEGSSGSSVNLVVQTKTAYEGSINPMRTDANTYVLMLPEMNSEASTPDLKNVSSNISSVNIRTMPYSNNAKGYTRITIKTTNPSMTLSASNQVFVSGSSVGNDIMLEDLKKNEIREERVPVIERQEETPVRHVGELVRDESEHSDSVEDNAAGEHVGEMVQESGLVETPVQPEPVTEMPSSSNNTYLWLWALLIVLGSAFFYAKAKNKMLEIAGEKINIDVNDGDKKESKRKNLSKIKKTIKTLDSSYSNSAVMPGHTDYTVPPAPVKTAKPAEELNIVDLDELFQEHKAKTSSAKEEEENDALEDFLSGFSFDEEENTDEAVAGEENSHEEKESFDEETYEKTIHNDNMVFSQKDTECINQLLDTEINDDTMRNIEKYALPNPVKKPSKQEILEDLVTTYSISQNIIFTKEDIDALYKLISVELDNDFITDLRTNPQRTEEMENDILAYGDKPKKTSEIITLRVKDMLPDLSEALKQQGNKKIESNHRAETIYYSEGYEVSKLSLGDSLPNLSVELNKQDAYTYKPSAEFGYADNSYAVGAGELKISSELPDLKDVLANPDKYASPEPEKVVVDEDALLKNISNVQFKPFYDGTNEFEVLNDSSDAPSVEDMKQEFSQFEGFEISEEENVEKPDLSDDYDDFKSLYSNEYVDFDRPDMREGYSDFDNQQQEIPETKVKQEPELTVKPQIKPDESAINHSPVFVQPKQNKTAADLVQKTDTERAELEVSKARTPKNETARNPEGSSVAPPSSEQIGVVRCILDGEVFTVVSSAVLTNDKGCYLAKNDNGYTVLGYIGEKLFKIQQYDELKSEKIHARVSERLHDGTTRYIIRIGVSKFIINVKENSIDYLMDL